MGFGGDVNLRVGRVGYWSLNDGAGNGARDWSYSGNDGTNSFANSWTNGVVGNCMYCWKTNWVSVPHSSSLCVAGDVSFGGWVKPNSSYYYQTIFMKGTGASRRYGMFLATGNTSAIYIALAGCTPGAGGNTYTITSPWVIGAWNHVFFTYKVSGGGAIYLNGQKVYDGSAWTGTPGHSETEPVSIGKETNDNSFGVDGWIDEVMLYSRALSAAEVMQLYARTRGQK
jgi:hypothetical protein